MAKPRISKKGPFDVKLSEDAQKDLADWLVREIEAARDARASVIGDQGDIEYSHFLYEQGRQDAKALRWQGQADLASYIVSEKVDALRARIVKTVFTEPVWNVEGWGADAERAPYVEEFHQWQQESERLQQYLTKVIHLSLIEQTGILEVLERTDVRLLRKLQQFAAKLADDGTVHLGDDGLPQVARDASGVPQAPRPASLPPAMQAGPMQPGAEPAADPGAALAEVPTVEAATATYELVRKGPGYRVVPLRDFLFLPGHAADKADLFGYAKRCWVRMGQLREREEAGYYTDIDKLSTLGDRDSLPKPIERTGQTLAEQREDTVEKEIWEVLFLKDLDGDGIQEWYVASVSLQDRVMIRLKHDDLGHPRYIDFTPFPRAESLYGYSFVLDKLGTLTEEHTSLRNMIADRSMLATIPPVKRLQGALWNPDEQPFGTGSVIDVRDMREVEPMVIPDVPGSAIQREVSILQAAERVAGVNDVASGQRPTEQRTLGEVQLVTEQSFVRMDEVVKNIQESLEVLFLTRHEIWIRTLSAQRDGIEPPDSVVRSIETRSLQIPNGKFTAQMLRGNFRGKPHGSVETADKARMRADFNNSLTALAGMAKMNPVFQGILQHPRVAKELIEQWARLYNVNNRQVFVMAFDQVLQQMQAQAEAQAQAQAQQQAMQQAMLARQSAAGPHPPGAIAAAGPTGAVPPQLSQHLAQLSDGDLDALEQRAGGVH
jgi:hypothetical protein